MPGSSCDGCTFQQFQDNNQVGCLLNRLDRYTNVDIINTEKNGFYKVLTENICPAFRDKQWLGKNPRRPELAVRQELFPRIQFFLVIRELTSEWIDFFATVDFSNYSVIDILLFQPEDTYVRTIGYLLREGKIFIHACYGELPEQLNYLVRDDCQFYLTVGQPDKDFVENFASKLDYHLNDWCQPVYLVEDQNFLLIYTPLHFKFNGYGTQTVEEKIRIDSINNDYSEGVFSLQDFLDRTTTESSGPIYTKGERDE